MPYCVEVITQPLLVFDELATLLFQLVELGVLPPERLPARGELPEGLLDRRVQLV